MTATLLVKMPKKKKGRGGREKKTPANVFEDFESNARRCKRVLQEIGDDFQDLIEEYDLENSPEYVDDASLRRSLETVYDVSSFLAGLSEL